MYLVLLWLQCFLVCIYLPFVFIFVPWMLLPFFLNLNIILLNPTNFAYYETVRDLSLRWLLFFLFMYLLLYSYGLNYLSKDFKTSTFMSWSIHSIGILGIVKRFYDTSFNPNDTTPGLKIRPHFDSLSTHESWQKISLKPWKHVSTFKSFRESGFFETHAYSTLNRSSASLCLP